MNRLAGESACPTCLQSSAACDDFVGRAFSLPPVFNRPVRARTAPPRAGSPDREGGYPAKPRAVRSRLCRSAGQAGSPVSLGLREFGNAAEQVGRTPPSAWVPLDPLFDRRIECLPRAISPPKDRLADRPSALPWMQAPGNGKTPWHWTAILRGGPPVSRQSVPRSHLLARPRRGQLWRAVPK